MAFLSWLKRSKKAFNINEIAHIKVGCNKMKERINRLITAACKHIPELNNELANLLLTDDSHNNVKGMQSTVQHRQFILAIIKLYHTYEMSKVNDKDLVSDSDDNHWCLSHVVENVKTLAEKCAYLSVNGEKKFDKKFLDKFPEKERKLKYLIYHSQFPRKILPFGFLASPPKTTAQPLECGYPAEDIKYFPHRIYSEIDGAVKDILNNETNGVEVSINGNSYLEELDKLITANISNYSMKKIKLRFENDIDEASAKKIANLIHTGSQNLTHLDLSDCQFANLAALDIVIEALRLNGVIQSLKYNGVKNIQFGDAELHRRNSTIDRITNNNTRRQYTSKGSFFSFKYARKFSSTAIIISEIAILPAIYPIMESLVLEGISMTLSFALSLSIMGAVAIAAVILGSASVLAYDVFKNIKQKHAAKKSKIMNQELLQEKRAMRQINIKNSNNIEVKCTPRQVKDYLTAMEHMKLRKSHGSVHRHSHIGKNVRTFLGHHKHQGSEPSLDEIKSRAENKPSAPKIGYEKHTDKQTLIEKVNKATYPGQEAEQHQPSITLSMLPSKLTEFAQFTKTKGFFRDTLTNKLKLDDRKYKTAKDKNAYLYEQEEGVIEEIYDRYQAVKCLG